MTSPYNTVFKSSVWVDLGLNPDLPDHWRTLYSLGQWRGTCFFYVLVIFHLKYVRTKPNLLGQWNIPTVSLQGGKNLPSIKRRQVAWIWLHLMVRLQFWISGECLLAWLPDPIWSGLVASIWVPLMNHVEHFNHLLYLKPFNCAETID